MQDPSRVYIDAGVSLAPGVRIHPGVHIEGASSIGPDSEVGPDVFISDARIGAGVKIWYSVLRGCEIGDQAQVGPYASLRPGTVLGVGAKAGTFVETKNASIGPHSKVPHLSYVGDAEIGEGVNVGAGTVTVNFDGVDKHVTTIDDGAFIGSDSMLVAPVRIGKNAMTAAGSVITNDVPDGALAVERSKQREIAGFGDRLAKRRAEKKLRRES
jgi:bifunctional UDP-N-acetylglucosamine pyrophosphorylase/glucosamine-1-phosphate N-acetyltransferase